MSRSHELEAVESENEKSEREIDFDKLVEKARKAELKALKKAEKELERANADTAEREARKLSEGEEGDARKGGKLRFEASLDRADVASYLESIVRGLRNGSLQFRRDDELLSLTPSARVDLSVKAASKKGRESIAFELEWNESSDGELEIVAD